jgi:hypothetical protein
VDVWFLGAVAGLVGLLLALIAGCSVLEGRT